MLSGYNHTFIISKTLRTLLPKPHGNCSSYESSGEQPFGAISNRHCVRRCVRYYWKQRMGLYPLLIDGYLHELDYETNGTETYQTFRSSETIYKELMYNASIECLRYCPQQCLTVDYNWKVMSSDTYIGNELWHNSSLENITTEKSLVWDSTQPLFVYREEPVMSLTDYMSYIGGLFCLWFGTNGKDFMIWLTEKMHFIWIWFTMKYNHNFTNNRVYAIHIPIN